MDLLIGTLVLRPYVFGFLLAFLLAGTRDLGGVRTLLFAAWVGPVAWLAEFSSTRVGVPFGLYYYTGTTRSQELFIADVPFMDCLSFTFLAYAAFCLARAVLRSSRAPWWAVALVSGVLMMMLDVVIDPAAVRGDRWFLGHIFYYPEGGLYFGVPISNFVGWTIVGAVGVGGYLVLARWRGDRTSGHTVYFDHHGQGVRAGIALYYAVLAFNLVVTGWIGEWLLLGLGTAIHAVTGAVLLTLGLRPAVRLGLEKQRA